MMSAGVSGFASFLRGSALRLQPRPVCFGGLAGVTVCTSAEASWKVAVAPGFARGAASADLASEDLVSEDLVSEDLASEDLAAEDLTGVAGGNVGIFVVVRFRLAANSDANRPGLLAAEASSPLPRFSMSASAS